MFGKIYITLIVISLLLLVVGLYNMETNMGIGIGIDTCKKCVKYDIFNNNKCTEYIYYSCNDEYKYRIDIYEFLNKLNGTCNASNYNLKYYENKFNKRRLTNLELKEKEKEKYNNNLTFTNLLINNLLIFTNLSCLFLVLVICLYLRKYIMKKINKNSYVLPFYVGEV